MMVSVYRVVMPTKNLEESIKFYKEVLGSDGWRVSPGRHYFDCSGTVISCYDAVANGDSRVPRTNEEYVYIAVDDIDATYRAAQAVDAALDRRTLPVVGVLGEVQTRPWGERSFYTKDPSGNPLCFTQEGTTFSKGTLPM